MLKRQIQDIVIRPRMSTPVRVAIAVVAALCMVAVVVFAYHQGLSRASLVRIQAEQRQAPMEAELTRMQAENRALRDENVRLRERNDEVAASLARAERQLQIDKTAYAELSASLADSTRQISGLREELSFYRSIIAPSDGRDGAQVQDFQITSTGEADRYQYRLTLIQPLAQSDPFRGRVDFEIEGSLGGEARVVRVPAADAAAIELSFRYFQTLEGFMNLPSEFRPSRVKVNVVAQGANAPVLEEWYAWPNL
jgi:cell division protein FtsB